MFSLRQEELLYSLRPAGQARIAPPMDDRRAWASFDAEASQALVARAERVLRAPLPHLTAAHLSLVFSNLVSALTLMGAWAVCFSFA